MQSKTPSPPTRSHRSIASTSIMISFCFSFAGNLLSLLFFASITTAQDPAIHLTLHRRGGRFATHDAANLTRLAEVRAEVETRYAKAERIIEGNRLGHQWKSRDVGTTVDEDLINAVGHDGRWYVSSHSVHLCLRLTSQVPRPPHER